ncbi:MULTISPECIES: helix-turn-helix domain-containing protein [Haloferax]|uniref:Helix-turn-helix domain-containing protein n=2 Tax=Haloferacaceae TaxID=1644056 RepID=A0ACD5I179_9EURY|nr:MULTISPECIES: helix-turn-helix domain-containing protein [Haloferax]RDZ30466.1 helix-turn-helix domain-containing protein [Haloferax sp. Atlit-48N]RDZ34363.1 helix-turn-helix domain-containing protein [Haloferax sp. Atlit-24N]RDZ35775.1 helix-turn-helix domain-containing protein [Haloferax sp. Atlit-47N]RLM33685.1 helix-turn-helix domain-containing protein [Haloferax sp. Atlit-109R]RLM40919.1 helix-turn-helix domain-containing protein [Haloferax sp. Atlit-105R]
MSVITEVRISPGDFELGQILELDEASAIELETLVPSGDVTVPLFWVYEPVRDHFLETVRRYPTVDNVTEVEVFDNRTLFRLDWDASQDHLFQCILDQGGQISSATGTSEGWDFEIRFSQREALSEFRTCCEDAHINLDVIRVYNPTDPGVSQWYGLSEPQREALTLAVQMGYYDIPRGCTTQELASELGISDQAVTERLRRAIGAFVRRALLTPEPET